MGIEFSNGFTIIANSTTTGSTFTNTAAIYYDPGNAASYNTSIKTLTNIGTEGSSEPALYGTLDNTLPYDGDTAGGIFKFNGLTKINFNTGGYSFGNTITLNVWVKPNSQYNMQILMANTYFGATTAGFKMGWNNQSTQNRKMFFESGIGDAGTTVVTAENTITYDSWQMLSYVFDNTNHTIKFFRNGTEIATESGGTPPAPSPSNPAGVLVATPWMIGSILGNGYYLNSDMGEFKIYKSLKNSSDLTTEYNATKSRYGL
jgi:hypothetical protein